MVLLNIFLLLFTHRFPTNCFVESHMTKYFGFLSSKVHSRIKM